MFGFGYLRGFQAEMAAFECRVYTGRLFPENAESTVETAQLYVRKDVDGTSNKTDRRNGKEGRMFGNKESA